MKQLTSKEKNSFDYIVIGGGLSGLSSAYHLKKIGKKVLVLEKTEIGGRTKAYRFKDTLIPFGAEFFTTKYKNILKLCRDLNIPLINLPEGLTYKVIYNNYKISSDRKDLLKLIPMFEFHNMLKTIIRFPKVLNALSMSSFDLEKLLKLNLYNLDEFFAKTSFSKSFRQTVAAINRMTFHYEDGLKEFSSAFILSWFKNIFVGKLVMPKGGIIEFVQALAKDLEIKENYEVREVKRVGDWFLVDHQFKAKYIIFATEAHVTQNLTKNLNLPEQVETLLNETYYGSVLRSYYHSKRKLNPGLLHQYDNQEIEYEANISEEIKVIKWRDKKARSAYANQQKLELIIENEIKHALPIYTVRQIENAFAYEKVAKQILEDQHIALAGDYIYGPYTESAVYSGIRVSLYASDL